MLEKYKLGIIGLKASHAERVKFVIKHFSQVEVLAAYCSNNTDLQYAKNELGLAYTYDDPQKLSDNNEIDAVMIWSDAKDHARHTVLALESNKHVIIDLPIATNKDDGEMVIKAAKRKPSQIVYCPFNFKLNSLIIKANHLIEKGEIGIPVMAQMNISDQPSTNGDDLMHRNIFMDIGVDAIGAIQYLTGKKVISVKSYGTVASDKSLQMTNDVDVAQVQAVLSDNCFAQFSFSRVGNAKSTSIYIQGTKSNLLIDGEGLTVSHDDSITKYELDNFVNDPSAFVMSSVNSFIDQLTTRGKSETALEESHNASIVVAAMAKSFLMKQEVVIEY